jgi:hypothetical protein
MIRRSLSALTLLAIPCVLASQQRPLPIKLTAKPTTAAITPVDLMSRLYLFADDSMMGRAAGTVYHDKGTDYIARELARVGLKPGGDNGTYFQQIPLMRRNLAEGTKVTVDGREFVAWRDFLPRDMRDFNANARAMENAVAVYGGVFGDTAAMISPSQASGKVIVFTVPRVAGQPRSDDPAVPWRACARRGDARLHAPRRSALAGGAGGCALGLE